MKYQVGKIQDLKPDDPTFDDIFTAYGHALREDAKASGDFFGVWTDQESGSELLAIVHQGDVFTR